MQSALLPAICPVYLCMSVGLWGATCCSACPVLCHSESGPLGFSVHECGPAGSASGQTACPICPTLRQSWSCHGHASPLSLGCPSPPLLPVWVNVYFLFPWCRTSLLFDCVSSGFARRCSVSTYPAILVLNTARFCACEPHQCYGDHLLDPVSRL